MPILIPIILILSYVVLKTSQFWFWNFDDGLIVYRIARNILEGIGWCYNAGEVHNPSTSVLNTVFIVILGKVGFLPSHAAHLLGGLALLIAAASVYILLERLYGMLYALASSLLIVFLLSTNSTWGLESNLFLACFFLLCLFEERKWNSWPLLGIMVLIRPDGMLLVGLKCLMELIKHRKIPLRGLIIVCAILSPWIIYSALKFGQLFPDTLSNKVWQGRSGFWGQGHIYLKFFLKTLVAAWWYYLPVIALAAVGLVTQLRDKPYLIILFMFVVLQQASYVLLNVPGYHWYLVNWDGSIALAACFGAGFILHRINKRALLLSSLPAAAFIIMDCYKSFGVYPIDPRDQAYQAAVQEVDTIVKEEGSLATLEVGTIGFHTKRSIVDLVGLASPNPEYISGKNNDRFFAALPTVIMFHAPIWHFERALADDLRFRMLYEHVGFSRDPFFPMQYYKLKSDAKPLSVDDLEKFVRSKFKPFKLTSDPALLKLDTSSAALCVIDQINGQLIRERSIEVQRNFLRINGWAVLKQMQSPTPPIKLMLVKTEMNGYELEALRTERQDVGKHLQSETYNKAGFELEGNILDLEPGQYQIVVIQRADESSMPSSCRPDIELIIK